MFPKRILLVDDEPHVRRAVARVFRRGFGDKVMLVDVGSSVEALEILRDDFVDLVVSDINRPDMDGIAFARTLRETATNIGTKLLVVTAEPNPSRVDEVRPLADDVAIKPVDPRFLVETAERLFGAGVDPDVALIRLGEESARLDYKRDVRLDQKKELAGLAKDVLAMANAGGGTIVVGVAEEEGRFVCVGLTEARRRLWDASRVNDALRRYVGVAVPVRVRIVEDGGKPFAVVRVPAAGDTLALAASDHSEANLHQGRIYWRTDDARSAEIRDSATLHAVLDRLVQRRLARERRKLH